MFKKLLERKWMKGFKYIITLIVFGVIILFLDQNNLIKRFNNTMTIDAMETEIEQCKNNYHSNTMRLHMLETNPHYIEKIAREKYLMKKPNEDVYVFEEKCIK
jgi:cell division protein FtsB